MNKKYIYLLLIIILIIICVFVIQKYNENTIYTSSNVTGYDNKKIEWGIKRNSNHEQPDLGSKNKEMMEKYNGLCIGNNSQKNIYLTFDAGYEAGYTIKILDVLKEKGVSATFFITSHYLNTANEQVKRMIEEGHIIGNHTVNHKSMPEITDEEIEQEVMKLHQAVYEKYNYEMRYIRPPKGEFSERTLKKCEDLGYKTVMWSFAYCDWDENKQPTIEEGKKKIVDNFHPGEIILLHSNSKTNSEILADIIDEARNQGYEFKTLDEFE